MLFSIVPFICVHIETVLLHGSFELFASEKCVFGSPHALPNTLDCALHTIPLKLLSLVTKITIYAMTALYWHIKIGIVFMW